MCCSRCVVLSDDKCRKGDRCKWKVMRWDAFGLENIHILHSCICHKRMQQMLFDRQEIEDSFQRYNYTQINTILSVSSFAESATNSTPVPAVRSVSRDSRGPWESNFSIESRHRKFTSTYVIPDIVAYNSWWPSHKIFRIKRDEQNTLNSTPTRVREHLFDICVRSQTRFDWYE